MSYEFEKGLKHLKYYFVSRDIHAATALMKCELPSNAINLLGGKSEHITTFGFIEMSKSMKFDDKSIIVFLKVGNSLDEKTLAEIERTRSNCFAMFCDVNDNYEYFIEEYADDLDYPRETVLRFCNLMDGILYESSDLKDVIKDYNSDLLTLKTRHAHTNCSKQLNPFSQIKGEDWNQFFKKDSEIQHSGIFHFGYMGRPKHCTDFLRLARAIYRVQAKSRFIHAHPNIETNMAMTYDIDMGFSLYDHDDWTRRLKPANKIMNYWSLGIPCLVSPFTSYRDIFNENNLDFNLYEIPERS
mgnify:CR=1 FL=1